MDAYLKKKIISKIAPLITATGLQNLFKRHFGGLGHVLMFHRVIPYSNAKRVHNHLSLEITPEHLEEVISFFIKMDYCFLSIDQLYENFKKGVVPERKFVVFTFDDGYRDNLEIAYPIFKKHKIPFTVYVTTGIPNKTAILWWFVLEDTLLNLDAIQFSWNDEKYSYNCRTPDEKEKTFEIIQAFIHKNFDIENYLELFKAIFNKYQHDLTSHSTILGMNWDEIRRLNEDPLVTIGAHTVNHFNLATLPGDILTSEILDSKTELEKQLGEPIKHFAYPYGKSHQASVREFECANGLGFNTATTTNIGNLFQEHDEMQYSLPRININRVTDKHVLKLQTCGLLPLIINKGKKLKHKDI